MSKEQNSPPGRPLKLPDSAPMASRICSLVTKDRQVRTKAMLFSTTRAVRNTFAIPITDLLDPQADGTTTQTSR